MLFGCFGGLTLVTGQLTVRCVDVQEHAVDIQEVQDQVQVRWVVGGRSRMGPLACFGRSWTKVLVADREVGEKLRHDPGCLLGSQLVVASQPMIGRHRQGSRFQVVIYMCFDFRLSSGHQSDREKL